MSFRRGVLSAIVFTGLGLGGAAAAAPAPTFDWSGFYAGVHAGIGWSGGDNGAVTDEVQQLSDVFVPTRGLVIVPGTLVAIPGGESSGSRGFFGGQAGYMITLGTNFVLGAEADLSTGRASTSSTGSADLLPTALASPSTITDMRAIKTSTAWSVRLRAGFAWDRYQVYATGGIAGADVDVTAVGTFNGHAGSAAGCALPCLPVIDNAVTNTTGASAGGEQTGWTIGGGGDYALDDLISVGLEYRHTDLGRVDFAPATQHDISVSSVTFSGPPGVSGPFQDPPKVILGPSSRDLTDDALTIRLNFHL